MARSTDIEPGSAELLLVDLLYGELEGDDAAAAEKAVAEDAELAADAAAFGELRALMRELPDQEPPAAISARLLHAAAARAPVTASDATAAGGGLWAWFTRIFRPLALNPALAAAATFVLVAGVAGTLYLTNRVEVSEPTAQSRLDAPTARGELENRDRTGYEPSGQPTEMTESSVSADPNGDDGVLDLRVTGEISDPLKDLGGEGEEQGAVERTPKRRAGPAPTKPAPRPKRVNEASKSEARGSAAGSGGGGNIGAQPTTGAPAGGKGASTTSQPDPAQRESDKQAPAKRPDTTKKGKAPPAQSPPPPKDVVNIPVTNGWLDGDAPAPDEEAPAAPEPAPPADSASSATEQAKRLHTTAQRAARDGECEAVIDLGQRIRKLDSRYYDTVFLRDKSLEPCRAAQQKVKKK